MDTENNVSTNSNNSIVAGVSSLIVLIVLIVMVTSLLNNKNISALDTKAAQLETNLQTMKAELSVSLKEQLNVTIFPIDNESDEIQEITETSNTETSNTDNTDASKQQTPIPIDTKDNSFNKLETQLKTISSKVDLFGNELNQQSNTLKNEVKVLAKVQNDKFRQIETKLKSIKSNPQSNSLQTTLKNEIQILAKTQKNKLQQLEIRLQSIVKDMINLQKDKKQFNSNLSQSETINSKLTKYDDIIKNLTVDLQSVTSQIANLGNDEQKIEQQINQLKATMEASLTSKLQQQNAKIEVLETQLQMLIGGLTGSTSQ